MKAITFHGDGTVTAVFGGGEPLFRLLIRVGDVILNPNFVYGVKLMHKIHFFVSESIFDPQ